MSGGVRGNPDVPPDHPNHSPFSNPGNLGHSGLGGMGPRSGQPTTWCPSYPTCLPDGRPSSRKSARGERALRLLLRTVVGVAGVLVERDDLHALLAVQVIVQLLRAAAEAWGAPTVPAAATLGGPRARGGAEAQVLGGQRLRGDGGGGQRREHRQLSHGQGRETSQRRGGGGGSSAGGGGRGRGGGGSWSGGGGGERGGPRTQAVRRGLGALLWRRRLERLRRAQGTHGAAALERAAAAVREELLPVLQISWVHFEKSRSAGVSGLQHVRRLKLGAEGKEEGLREQG
uniref:Putative histone-lysine N-methyltransferase PRDM6 isoform X2 n=1 Tax=Sus scrofa TaxID=9823 RepID=A0A480J659_PIG